MKKSMFCIIAAFVLMALIPMQLNAATLPVGSTGTVDSTEAKVMTLRLEEINAMDKSKLTAPEKRQLRKEVRSIKKRAAINGGGVYISGGVLLLIIILLIVFL